MPLKEVKGLAGKIVKGVTVSGDNYDSNDDRQLEMEFTDGTTLSFEVLGKLNSQLKAECRLFLHPDGDKTRKLATM